MHVPCYLHLLSMCLCIELKSAVKFELKYCSESNWIRTDTYRWRQISLQIGKFMGKKQWLESKMPSKLCKQITISVLYIAIDYQWCICNANSYVCHWSLSFGKCMMKFTILLRNFGMFKTVKDTKQFNFYFIFPYDSVDTVRPIRIGTDLNGLSTCSFRATQLVLSSWHVFFSLSNLLTLQPNWHNYT